MSHKKWAIVTLASLFIALFTFALVTIVIDPFFQYHKPLESLEYPMPDNMQRQISYGIAKNFDYELLITGSSVTENFLASEFEQLFDKQNAIKLPLKGATGYETLSLVEAALEANLNLDTVVFNLNSNMFLKSGPDYADFDQPKYLYDNNLFNDTNYFLNKEIFSDYTLGVLEYTNQGNVTPNFDDYSFWHDTVFDDQAFLNRYSVWNATPSSILTLSEQEKQTIATVTKDGILRLASSYPDVEFIVFFPPNCVLWWNDVKVVHPISYWFDRKEFIIEQLLSAPNINTYFFMGETNITTDFSKYIDTVHYSADINSFMANEFTKDTYLLTEQNYKHILNDAEQFYSNYDFETLLNNRTQ